MKKKIIAITKRQIYLSKNGRIKDYLSKDWLDFSKSARRAGIFAQIAFFAYGIFSQNSKFSKRSD